MGFLNVIARPATAGRSDPKWDCFVIPILGIPRKDDNPVLFQQTPGFGLFHFFCRNKKHY